METRSSHLAVFAIACLAVLAGCTPGTRVTAPTSTPTTNTSELMGTYVKRGTRTRESTCKPPVLGETFEVPFTVEPSSSANLGIRLSERHSGQDNVGPWSVNLAYSELTWERLPTGLQVESGSPTRNIGSRTYTTHISVFFADDGTFLGTETIEFEGPPPCKDTYIINGERAK